jgi:hypothetical protein
MVAMHVLFVHPNFPAQFRSIAPRLAADYGWTCTFATENQKAPALPGVEKVVYRTRWGATGATPFEARPFDNAMGHARGVYEALRGPPDIKPDLVPAGVCESERVLEE